MPINKVCAICGKPFTVSPSAQNQKCCSKKCGAALRTQNGNRCYKWSEESKSKRANDPVIAKKMAEIQRAGVEAALKLKEWQRAAESRIKSLDIDRS